MEPFGQLAKSGGVLLDAANVSLDCAGFATFSLLAQSLKQGIVDLVIPGRGSGGLAQPGFATHAITHEQR